MALSLGGLLGDQLAARRDRAVLGGMLQGIGPNRLAGRRAGTAIGQLVGGLAGLDAADEAVQPLLLLVVEFAHAATRLVPDGAHDPGGRVLAYARHRVPARVAA